MRHNPKINAFLDKLASAGVTYRTNWETRRDGKPLSNGRPFGDVIHLTFVGNGFSPSVGTAIVVDYGDRDGFGIYYEAETNSIDDDIARIAKPRAKDVAESAVPDMLAALHAVMQCARGELERPVTQRQPWGEVQQLVETAIAKAEATGIKERAPVTGPHHGPSLADQLRLIAALAGTTDRRGHQDQRDAAAFAETVTADMLAALKALLPEVDNEIEQRQHGGNDEDWEELKVADMRKMLVHMGVNLRCYGNVEVAANTVEAALAQITADFIADKIVIKETTTDSGQDLAVIDVRDAETGEELANYGGHHLPSPYDPQPDAELLAALKRLRRVAVWDDDTDMEEYRTATAEADAAIAKAERDVTAWLETEMCRRVLAEFVRGQKAVALYSAPATETPRDSLLARILHRIENDGPKIQREGHTEVGVWDETALAEMIKAEFGRAAKAEDRANG
ncbi:hypothetical protein MPL3356_60557 [Mesorhizobium plurifarium]|uniref:Uncharacterized protein n=1 Tax=Mesorhizobium plurifarium TaxID=69974 RepID=A0A090EA19_MESPL|nr:hypothetical protein MPL3356_60557 [Mesorhizobium plurifarium]